MMTRLVRISLASLATAVTAQAAVIANDATISPASGGLLVFDRQFHLTQTAFPGRPGFSGLFLLEVTTAGSTQFTFSPRGIAEDYKLHTVAAGDLYTLAYVNSNQSFASNTDASDGVLTLGLGESSYIAYWDDIGNQLGAIDDSGLFGWARLENIGGELSVTASATALGGGIIVGSLQQIPEPSAALLAFSGLALAFIRRR